MPSDPSVQIDIKPRSRDVTDGLEKAAARGMLRAIGMEDDDFARADAIRAELLAKGIILEDGPKGTTWRRAKSLGTAPRTAKSST